MYRKIETDLHVTENEASEIYPDNYILMQKENRNLCNPVGVVRYVGNDFDELFDLQIDLPVPLGVVIEGLNLQRSLGGVVVRG